MLVPLTGALLLLSGAAVVACAVVIALLGRARPRPTARILAAAAGLLGCLAAAVYCGGRLSVALGGPFPALCEDVNLSGAPLERLRQEYWPLRNACLYADGSSVEHLPPSINVFALAAAVLAAATACAAVFVSRRTRSALVRAA
ncbi:MULTISPECIES: hypothetical protein [unclassified Streptomyces]|uniref:hypothetical protein n=1 Tax=unclassified Streptomyces TaxID=2593676 RepID=UPI00067CDCA4|nr:MULTISPECIES: hypothetical protein [unclassified Streptomyces]